MSYRWRQNSITGSMIVNAREYDRNYNNYVSVINGGFDRDNLPQNTITYDDFEEKSVGRYGLVNNINADDDYGVSNDANYTGGTVNPRGNSIAGLKFEDSPIEGGGFWFPVGDVLVMDCEEGMANIRFHINSYCPKYYHYYTRGTTNRVARRTRQWKIEVDGVEVSRTSEIFPQFYTANMQCQVPVSKGNHEFQAYCKIPSQEVGDSSGAVVLNYWGGQLSVHNRRR